MNAPTTDLAPKIPEEMRTAALATLRRLDALDLAEMLGLDDDEGANRGQP